jgi:hypothetical protein
VASTTELTSTQEELRVLRFTFVLFLFSFIWAPGNAIASSASAHKVVAGAVKSDSEIQQTLEAKLAKSKIGKDRLRFQVSRGVVTWEGTTNVMQHKGSATRMARTAGAVKVVNNIKVTGSAASGVGLKKATVVE